MTPQYLAARTEVRERTALSIYRTKRTLYKAHVWSSADIRAAALREALIARAVWNYAHELRREPTAVAA